MDEFKVPQSIPQDLLLIHDIIGITKNTPVLTPSQKLVVSSTKDSIDSSDDDENASEDEIEADLIVAEDDEAPKPMHVL